MRKFIISIIGALLCSITLFSQNSDNAIGNNSYEKKKQLQVPQFMPVLEPNQLYPISLLATSILLSYQNNAYIDFKLKNSSQLKHLYLSLFNTRSISWGIADINNVGVGLLWQSSSKASIEGGTFISKQYGYNLNSRHLSLGLKLNFNYQLSNKLKLSLWGQYLIKQNTDPFMKLENNQPRNGVGLRLEYNPNINTKYSIDISKQKDFINSQKSLIQIEGKAGFKF